MFALAAPINIGLFSFDVLISGSEGSPGVVGFQILNLSGDPQLGGSALSPDFPVMTPLVYRDVEVSVLSSGITRLFTLPDIAPGSLAPSNLQFSSDTQFESAMLQLSLNTIEMSLEGGMLGTAVDDSLLATITPSVGSVLVPGQDLQLLTISLQDVLDVPEPSTLLSLTSALGFLSTRAIRRRR
jgi:hypothetical protein